MKTAKRLFGDWGEACAVKTLEEKGYEIIERNYRVKRGELDIVAWHTKSHFGKTLCFIEVKTRRLSAQAGGERGSAERATGYEKRSRVATAARHWCFDHEISLDRTPIQFEQISVYDTGVEGKPEMYHYVIPSS